MGYGLKLLAIITCLALGFLSGTLLFMKGFLLKRIVIDDKSKCNESIPWSSTRYPIPVPEKAKSLNRGCWIDTKFSKAVIIIIDALRYDFANFNDSIVEEDALPFQNKLSVFHEVMRDSPQNGMLYKFVADPPTTTMQRLKGLTTGSLPTFVDAGANFATYEIKEDNIISILVDSGKKITFMGDDTWEGLFPKTFHKSYPFPSFNIKDLDTVDNGVIKHLLPELKQPDWDVMIAHFLGVDHCGHTYGPYHKAMANKLMQMDKVLRSVIDVLDDETVLFVLGDHGMTRTGDHGGDSIDELDSVLFVYSKSPLVDTQTTQITSNTISQVDFVPTFALLLGIPIPFGSLGSAVTELFTKQGYQFHTPGRTQALDKQRWSTVMSGLKVLHVNAHQVDKYLQKYQLRSSEMPKTTLESLKNKLTNATERFHKIAEFTYHGKLSANSSADLNIKELEILEQMYKDYLFGVKELCHGLWAKFDVVSMILGIVLQILSLVVMLLSIFNQHFFRKTSSSIFKWTMAIGCFSGLFCFVITPTEPYIALFHTLICFSVGFTFVAFYYFKEKAKLAHLVSSLKELTAEDLLATVFCFCYFTSYFSNSYIVYEDSVVLFSVSSLVTFLLVINFVKSRTGLKVIRIVHRHATGVTKKNTKEAQKFDVKAFITSFNFRLIVALMLFVMCGRLSSVFRACREEQATCEPTSFLQSLSSLQGTSSINVSHRFFLSSICVALIPIALYSWLRYQGNLNGSTPVVLCVKYSLPFCVLFMFIHWALQILPQDTNSQLVNFQLWHQVILPQFVYWLCILTLLLLLWKPLCLYTLLRDKQSSLKDSLNSLMVSDSIDARALQTVFREVKRTWDRKSAENGPDPEDDGPPVVYGLGTVYSCPVLVMIACFAMVIMLLLSDGMVGSIVLLVAQMILFVEIQASIGSCDNSGKGLPWYVVVVWGMMSSQYFFNTGHQATIPAVRFEASFVGLPGDMNNHVLPGLLIFLNTFASSVLFAVGLPVLLLWPCISNRILGKNPKQVKDDATSDKGEFGFSDKPESFRENLFRLIVMYLCFSCLKVLFLACSAGLHRRHLMVWKIFAPRFVFESISFVISVPFIILAYVLMLRTDCALEKWTEKLQTHIAMKSKTS